MIENIKNRIKGKRYQELSKPYRIIIWLMYMPFGYIRGIGWYFVKRLRWEDVCDETDDFDKGRVSLKTCISICVGKVQGDMHWYYKIDEVFRDDGTVISRDKNKGLEGFFNKMFEFIEDKIIELIDGKTIYD